MFGGNFGGTLYAELILRMGSGNYKNFRHVSHNSNSAYGIRRNNYAYGLPPKKHRHVGDMLLVYGKGASFKCQPPQRSEVMKEAEASRNRSHAAEPNVNATMIV